MRASFAIFALALLAGCGTPPQRVEQPKPDPTREAWYGETVEQLKTLNREAEDLFQRGRSQEAAAAITRGERLQARLLTAPQPTLAAMEAVSERDDLYARMLLSNHHEGWARMLFQKNVARWKAWEPRTAETARHLQKARAGIAQCDRRLGQ